MKYGLSLILIAASLSGCSGTDGLDDLRQFMDEAGKKSASKVAPLPPPQPHDTFVFQAAQVPDPFAPRSLKGAEPADSGRARGTLEEYALDGMRVTGIIERDGVFQALIATPDNRLHAAKLGDRIGQNNGVVIAVSYKGLKIKERIAATPGKWTEVITELNKPQDADIREIKRGPGGKWSNSN